MSCLTIIVAHHDHPVGRDLPADDIVVRHLKARGGVEQLKAIHSPYC